MQQQIQHKIDNKTKPPGALGQLEAIALKGALILNTDAPEVRQPHIVVFAGDHGIAATGLVNPFPQAVTAQMVHNFLAGGAAINVFCRLNNLELKVVNAGVLADFTKHPHPGLIDVPLAMGTADYRRGPAMSLDAAEEAIVRGRAIVRVIAEGGCNTIGFGEMGIGNTSSAALLMSALTGIALADCVGAGTGAQGEALRIKQETLAAVFATHELNEVQDPVALLSLVGGFEIAMMTGAYLEAAAQGMIILVDGFIATAALLVAQAIDRKVLDHCLFAHSSAERGHEALLRHLGATPILQLGLRLGEGTGAALAVPLVRAAFAFLNEMASFDSAGVSNKTES